MPPPSHNFRSYFTLTNNPNNPTNAIAVYNYCIRKYARLEIAQLKPEYCTVNRARLCHTHLLKCEAFRKTYSNEFKTNESVNLHTNSVISTVSSHSSVNTNDLLRFEQLLLRIIVSNALPFTFVENENTIAIFEFLIPGLKLPKRKVIDYQVSNDSYYIEENKTTRWTNESLEENKYLGAYGSGKYSDLIYLLDVSKRDSYKWVIDFIPS
ncbi:15283_t:CDS:2 [Gigaspora margarita]|uniref:15283_t:CDS:1 n=1 Tax=Gigaspora margarita TaxID=4874 RepID=A0ABM8VXW5_GIGMA|nr:15283_t:CDS:2 [Gigaspora margarita]